MADLKTYSVVIRWSDSYDDMGDFGEFVKARDGGHAERIVRASMIRQQWSERDPDTSKRDSLELYANSDGTFFGSVVECYEGAIWKAAELEKRLRALLAVVDEVAGRCGWADNGERALARMTIADLDAL